jgi:hypothetical protein
MAALAALPLTLPGQGRLAEAWEYVQLQLELFPNAVTSAVASLLCYHRAHQAEGEARAALLAEQVRSFERAREEYARLPAGHREHPEIQAIMGRGNEAAALALRGAGDEQGELLIQSDDLLLAPSNGSVDQVQGRLEAVG